MEPIRTFDYGNKGCGEGVSTQFKQDIAGVDPGQMVEVIVREPSARTDLPAMCRMLGHDLVWSDESDGVLRMHVVRAR